MNSIQEKDVLTINLADFEVNSPDLRKKLATSRLLSLKNCDSWQKAVEFIQFAHEEINLSPYVFVITIEIRDDAQKVDFALEINNVGEFISGEKIIEIIQGNYNSIFVRENSLDGNFVEVLRRDNVGNFFDNFPESFKIENLLSFLCHENEENIGIGNLLELKVDTNKQISGCTLLDFAVKHGKILCLKFLKLFNYDLASKNGNRHRPLEIAVSECSDLNVVKVLLDYPTHYLDEYPIDLSKRELIELENDQGNSLLMTAASIGHLEMVKFFLKFYVNLELKNKNEDTAADIAEKMQHFDILCELLKFDSPYPDSFITPNHPEIVKINSDRDIFHSAIVDNDLGQIKKFAEENPQLKIAFNDENCSAIKKAIQSRKFEAYSLLRSLGFCKGNDEDLQITDIDITQI